jgi:DNA repair protein RadC
MKKQLESQSVLFDQKWEILERETRQLTLDKEKFNREKLMYRDKVYREARRSMSNAENVKIFFRGVDDTESVKKRYRALLKIYHPDNMHGDKELLQAINTEYERLSRFYLGT